MTNNIEVGKQYLMDDKLDQSGFLRLSRLHQSKFRAEKLKLPCGEYGNYLLQPDGEKGYNFYNGFNIYEAVRKKHKKYIESVYSNMLRSEHIPFNFFIPLKQNMTLFRDILNEFMSGSVDEVTEFIIEYAPKPARKYLDDKTSFDVYIEYSHRDGTTGIIGIEIKYTEGAYKLTPNSKEARFLEDKNSPYNQVTAKCDLYLPDTFDQLKTDTYRQIWRNQLLGESILINDHTKYAHFTSILFYPMGNTHFREATIQYAAMLRKNKYKFIPIAYEEFLSVCNEICDKHIYGDWLNYLRDHYLVSD